MSGANSAPRNNNEATRPSPVYKRTNINSLTHPRRVVAMRRKREELDPYYDTTICSTLLRRVTPIM